ncbi:MAG: lipopolysaccharide biosynthesis protein [Rhodopseudomonas sp.]|uniref:GumC family protein n=1 Tax=Rhodopseudomonas sp. TaxID=1078 RepID=UPI0018145BF5|nr:exopolysaccharide transport family protein [Rhodopseudomonas sp.]NVN86484.1 lipopolysaccharide biosynthesis protein [Rhodopseudomonas sp.]
MRFAFWRAGKDKAPRNSSPADTLATDSAEKPKKPKVAAAAVVSAPNGDMDLRLITQALGRKKHLIIGPTLLALVISIAAVNLITPRYKSEARILIDGRENVFLRPNGERNEERNALDPEAVTSQVQLLLSRDLAREIIKKNKLAERPEFDPVLQGLSPVKSLLALFGIGRDPFSMTPEERVLDAYFDRLTAYAVDKSRVVVIEFQSRDPDLAARVANSIADGYLVLQQGARQAQAKSAGQWLSGEIDSLRKKVGEAESRVEDFRSKSSLFIGTNNTSLSNQQMGELNTQLNNARALKSDAESKARLIREMLQSGKPIEASEVMNSELTRRLSEQRVTLSAQLAEQSSTLLDGHPRIKELKAQLANLDRQLREEASKISRSLDNDARIAGGRVEGLTASLEQLKKQASSSNGQDVQLRALEREAKAQRDLLESYLAKYREATTRESIDAAPADGRIISRAIVSNTPAYPKKLPIVLIATLATLMLTAGGVATGELLRITQPRGRDAVAPVSADPVALPVVTAPPVAPELAAAPVGPAVRDTHPELAAAVGEIESLAQQLRAAGDAARKVTVLGTGKTESVTLTALTLARLLARHAKVVLVDLSESSATLKAVSVDTTAPGLAELMLGEASFGQVITKDRMSGLHLISAGRPGFDRALLQSPRLTLALDALLRVYDHVLLDAGTAADLPAELLTAQARAIVVPDPAMPAEARTQMADQLKAIGFSAVTMLSKPSQPADATEPGARSTVAA